MFCLWLNYTDDLRYNQAYRWLNVKTTMISWFANLIAPDYCYGCSKVGQLLCGSCKYDISSESTPCCLLCLKPNQSRCSCNDLLSASGFVDLRTGVLEQLTNDTKFLSKRQGAIAQAELLATVLPMLPEKSVLLPVPTIARHIRLRGFDHTKQIARYLAKQRQAACDHGLVARTSLQLVQHGASRQQRLRQATQSFRLAKPIDPDLTYIIIDDVVTTGATVLAIAKLLKQAGADNIWAWSTTRQPPTSENS